MTQNTQIANNFIWEKKAAVKAWKGMTKEECNSLVMSMGHRLDTTSKGYATKYYFHLLKYSPFQYFCSPKKGVV